MVSIAANFTGPEAGVNKKRGKKNCIGAQNFARLLQMTEPALDLVIAALEKIRETNDRFPNASKSVLARLQTASAAARRFPLRTAHATAADAVESDSSAGALAKEDVPSGQLRGPNKA